MSFYIGVDGGGTKTAFSLFDEDKNVVKTVYGPGSNHENLDGAFDDLDRAVDTGAETAGIGEDDVHVAHSIPVVLSVAKNLLSDLPSIE